MSDFVYQTDNATPKEIAGTWGQMRESSGCNYIVIYQPTEEFWLDIGENDSSKAISPDLSHYSCPNDYSIQPIYFGSGVYYVGGCFEKHPGVYNLTQSLATLVSKLSDSYSVDGPRVVGPDGEVFSMMTDEDDSRVFFQAFLNVYIPDYVDVEEGNCYIRQPTGVGNISANVFSEIEADVKLNGEKGVVDFDSGTYSDWTGTTSTKTYELPVVGKRPKYVGDYVTRYRGTIDPNQSTAIIEVTATDKVHDWLSNRQDVILDG